MGKFTELQFDTSLVLPSQERTQQMLSQLSNNLLQTRQYFEVEKVEDVDFEELVKLVSDGATWLWVKLMRQSIHEYMKGVGPYGKMDHPKT